MTGDQPRHMHMASKLSDSGFPVSLVVEAREPFVPDPPDDIPPSTRDLFIRHFDERAETEDRHFGLPSVRDACEDVLDVTLEELNTDKV